MQEKFLFKSCINLFQDYRLLPKLTIIYYDNPAYIYLIDLYTQCSVNLNQGTFTLGSFLAHASILCTVKGADLNKESFPYPGTGSRGGFRISSRGWQRYLQGVSKSPRGRRKKFRVNEIGLGADLN